MNENIFAVINNISNLKLSTTRLKLVLYSILTGLLTGLVVVMYRLSLEKVINIRNRFEISGNMTKNVIIILILFAILKYTINFINNKFNIKINDKIIYLISCIFFIVLIITYSSSINTMLLIFLFILSAILIQFMLNFKPLISGSGIPQVMGLLQNKTKFNWFYELILKFTVGVLAIFTGLSLGREGPSIHLGSIIADGVNKISKRSEVEKKYLITSGASAGLSAAFNAPLAGTIFALEELHKFFSPLMLICSILASISANLVSILIIGEETAFINFKQLSPVKDDVKGIILEIFLILILSILIVVLGKIFNIILITFQKTYKNLKINKYFKIILSILISYLVVVFLPDITGGGNTLIEKLLTTSVTTRFLVLLLITKFLFTMFSYSTGAPGGIFLPMLVIGALIGRIYGIAVVNIFNLPSEFVVHFMLLSMAAYFTAIVRAPITGIVLILEMTGNFSNLFSLTIISAITYIVSELMKFKSVYEELFHNMFSHVKNEIEPKVSESMTAVKIPIISGSKIVNKYVKDISWPSNLLVVGIERNNFEFIPKGDTKILDGDKLVIFTDRKTAILELEKIFEISIKEEI